MPGCEEDIVWVFRFMSGDGAVEFLLAYVALTTYQYLIHWVKKKKKWSELLRKPTHGQTVSETMEILKLVILRAMTWAARLILLRDRGYCPAIMYGNGDTEEV